MRYNTFGSCGMYKYYLMFVWLSFELSEVKLTKSFVHLHMIQELLNPNQVGKMIVFDNNLKYVSMHVYGVCVVVVCVVYVWGVCGVCVYAVCGGVCVVYVCMCVCVYVCLCVYVCVCMCVYVCI